MKIVIQRVRHANVSVKDNIVGEIKKGLLLLIGIAEDDTHTDADWIINKIVQMRIFPDKDGKMNLSILDTKGEILCISQFTLMAEYKKGNRPSFIKAAKPENAIILFEYIKEKLSSYNITIQSGIFGEDMQVSLLNDGPVTIVVDSKTKN